MVNSIKRRLRSDVVSQAVDGSERNFGFTFDAILGFLGEDTLVMDEWYLI